jgi:hypothetical protein
VAKRTFYRGSYFLFLHIALSLNVASNFCLGEKN